MKLSEILQTIFFPDTVYIVRTPELLYQPSMLGVEQAGIAETIEFALTKFSCDEQRRLCQVRLLLQAYTMMASDHDHDGRSNENVKN